MAKREALADPDLPPLGGVAGEARRGGLARAELGHAPISSKSGSPSGALRSEIGACPQVAVLNRLYGISTVDPVVRRPSSASWAARASARREALADLDLDLAGSEHVNRAAAQASSSSGVAT